MWCGVYQRFRACMHLYGKIPRAGLRYINKAKTTSLYGGEQTTKIKTDWFWITTSLLLIWQASGNAWLPNMGAHSTQTGIEQIFHPFAVMFKTTYLPTLVSLNAHTARVPNIKKKLPRRLKYDDGAKHKTAAVPKSTLFSDATRRKC